MTAYPALVDDGDSVAVRLFATPEEQSAAMWDGTRRLLVLDLPSPSRHLRSLVTEDGKKAIAAGPYPTFGDWADDCLSCAVDDALDQGRRSRLELRRRSTDSTESSNPKRPISSSRWLPTPWRSSTSFGRFARRWRTLAGDHYADARSDINEQLDRLIYPGFLTGVGIDRLSDMLRYIRAITRRLEALPDRVERDRELMERIRELETERDDLSDAMPGSIELIDVAWMLQELRVSSFAQGAWHQGQSQRETHHRGDAAGQ